MTLNHPLAVLALCCALLAPAASAWAEDAAPAAAAPAKPKMEQELGLTPEQTQQVRTIMQEQDDKRRALWKETAERDQIPDRMRALHEETRQRLATVLDKDQMAKMEQHLQERRGHGHRGGPGREPPSGEYMTSELDLNAEQQVAVKEIFADTHKQRQAIMESEADRTQKHQQMTALHAGVREKMAGILDEKQLARFDELHQKHMQRMERHGKRKEHRRGDKAPPAGDKPAAAEPEPAAETK